MTVGSGKRIGVFVTGAFVHRDYLQAVSGHVQIAVTAAQILARAGHEVTLITTREEGMDCLPYDVAGGLEVCVVPHASRSWPRHRIYPGRAVRQVVQLRTLIRKRRFDTLHFFGGTSTGLLPCLLKLAGAPCQAFYTPIRRPPMCRSRVRNGLMKRAFARVERFLPVTEYVSAGWRTWADGRPVDALYPGIRKSIAQAIPETADTVLFWRNAGYANGADLTLDAFRRLAPEHTDVRFVFAVRPHDQYEPQMQALARAVPNVETYIYPYEPPISLEALLSRSLFVVQPFRSLQINPQLSTVETLYAGVPVVTTDVDSNGELVQHEQTGLLIPPDDVEALVAAIGRLLEDRTFLGQLQCGCASATEARWNWDAYGRVLLKAHEDDHE